MFRTIVLMLFIVWGVKASNDRLPLPRFATLKTDLINLRVGPGENFPITDVYKKKNFPVQIVAEFQDWRKIKDFEGTTGWVHKSMLKGKRFCLILKPTFLFKKPLENSGKKAKVHQHVVAELKNCDQNFCRLVFSDMKMDGWVLKNSLWGV